MTLAFTSASLENTHVYFIISANAAFSHAIAPDFDAAILMPPIINMTPPKRHTTPMLLPRHFYSGDDAGDMMA